HVPTRRADQAIRVEADGPQEDVVGERGIGQPAGLMAEVGEQDEPPPAIADVDMEILDPGRGRQRAAGQAAFDLRKDASGGFRGYGLVRIQGDAAVRELVAEEQLWVAEED